MGRERGAFAARAPSTWHQERETAAHARAPPPSADGRRRELGRARTRRRDLAARFVGTSTSRRRGTGSPPLPRVGIRGRRPNGGARRPGILSSRSTGGARLRRRRFAKKRGRGESRRRLVFFDPSPLLSLSLAPRPVPSPRDKSPDPNCPQRRRPTCNRARQDRRVVARGRPVARQVARADRQGAALLKLPVPPLPRGDAAGPADAPTDHHRHLCCLWVCAGGG